MFLAVIGVTPFTNGPTECLQHVASYYFEIPS
jgi:hypothetical protein